MAFGDRLSNALNSLSQGFLTLDAFRTQQRDAVSRQNQQKLENENALTRIGISRGNAARGEKQFKSNEAQRFLDNLFRTGQSDERIRQFDERQLQQGNQFDQTFGLADRRVSLAESRPLRSTTTKTQDIPVGLQTQAFKGGQERFFENRLVPGATDISDRVQPPITQATQDSSVVAGANAIQTLRQQLGFGGGQSGDAQSLLRSLNSGQRTLQSLTEQELNLLESSGLLQ